MSQAGKEVLIKSIVQALPTYAMSMFLLPLDIIRDFERSLSRYWWGVKDNPKSGIFWMNWEKLTKNRQNGGLGFRDFRSFNLALLGKQSWRLATQPNILSSKLYKSRYFSNCHFLDSKLGGRPNYIWRSIWEVKQVVKDEARWKVGDWSKIKILGQPWLQVADNPCIATEVQGLNHETVSSLMTSDRQQWDRDVIEDLFSYRDQQCILKTTIGGEGREDTLFWNEDASEEYTVRSAYRLLQRQKEAGHTFDNSNLWKVLWRIKAPAKVLYMVWRALSRCLPTKKILRTKHVPVSEICPVCNGDEETIIHALVSCPFAAQC